MNVTLKAVIIIVLGTFFKGLLMERKELKNGGRAETLQNTAL